MEGLAVILRRTRSNRYSLAALVAAIDLWAERVGARPPRIYVAGGFDDAVNAVKRYSSAGYRIVTLYSFMTTELAESLDTLKKEVATLRRLGALTIAGGPHPTGDPLGTLRLGFDYVVVGEAEETLPELLNALAQGLDEERVAGIVYRHGDHACYTGKPRPVDLDMYPNFPYWRGVFAPIEITRGCPFACRFCQVSYTQGGRLRHRSLDSTLALAESTLRAGRRDLRFITPNAFSYLGDGLTINLSGLCELVEGLSGLTRRYGGRFFLGSFPSEVRPEHAAEEEAVKCIAGRVANRRVIVGAQSGSERILKLMNRGHTVSDVIAAVENLNKHGFEADVDIIIGYPGESWEDLEDTIRLAELLTTKYRARIHAHYYLPLPGTPVSGLEPSRPPERLVKRLYKLLGRGLVYGDWLKQYELSWRITSLYREGVIIGIRGYRVLKRCSRVVLRPYPYAPSAS